MTLARLSPSIPDELTSTTVEAAFMDELRRRVARGQFVDARRARSAQAAMLTTLRRLFNPRGGISERFIDLAVVLDDEAYADASSDMREGEIAWSIFPTHSPRWVYIGPAIQYLESLRPGAGETVLHAINAAAKAVSGVLVPDDARELAQMLYWDNASDDDIAADALGERGHEADDEDRPLLPSEFDAAAGGDLWLKPRRVLGREAIRSALAPLRGGPAARLHTLVSTHLPRVAANCQRARERVQGEGSWSSHCVAIWSFAQDGGFASRLLDDVEQDRMNSGESDVLYRCDTDARLLAPRPRRKAWSAQHRPPAREPKPADALAVVAAHLWVYHYLDLTLCALVDLQNALPHQGEGNQPCN